MLALTFVNDSLSSVSDQYDSHEECIDEQLNIKAYPAKLFNAVC